jgi:hypothetical protein
MQKAAMWLCLWTSGTAMAAPEFWITGSCPGNARVQGTGFTPGGAVEISATLSPSTNAWSSGACASTERQTWPTDPMRTLTADAQGRINQQVRLTAGMCGYWAEATDTTTCMPTGTWPLAGWPRAAYTPTLRDHDMTESGSYVTAQVYGGRVQVTCAAADGTPIATQVVGSMATSGFGSSVGVWTNRPGTATLVAWRNYYGPGEDLRYAWLDSACQPVVRNAIIASGEYFEFFDAAISDDGQALVTWSDGDTEIAAIDPTGTLRGVSHVMDISASYGTHIAMNQLTGAGIVAAQVHSGNGIYYRRFDHTGTWIDAAPVLMPVDYHYWYDGFTVGMNDTGAFVFEWRGDGDHLGLRFYDSMGNFVNQVDLTTPDFEGWAGGHSYDSFRLRHQEIPLDGPNFVVGEVYNWIAGSNLSVQHFCYSPTGLLLASGATTHSVAEGMTIRTDGHANAILRDNAGLHWLSGYP